jgi:hypothetical protein
VAAQHEQTEGGSMSFWVDTPYTPAYVRDEFLYDKQSGQGDFTEVTVFGFRAEPMRVPMFQLMGAYSYTCAVQQTLWCHELEDRVLVGFIQQVLRSTRGSVFA